VGKVPRGYFAPHISPGGVFLVSNCADVEILNCRGGSNQVLGWGLGSNFLNGGKVRGLRMEGNVSWGSRYHVWIKDASDVLVKNNTFAATRIQSFIIDGRAENIRILNNIWYGPCGRKKNNEVILFRSTRKNVVSDHNLFFSTFPNHTRVGTYQNARRETEFRSVDLAEWQQKTGQDPHSLRADPRFVDAKKGDFRLKPGSPALGAGKDGANIGALGLAE